MSTGVLEELPDEILLIICEYLSQKDIVRAFFDLNYRFNCIISQFCHSLMIVDDDYAFYSDKSREQLSIIGPFIRSLTIKQTRLSEEQMKLAPNIEELTFIDTDPAPIPALPHLSDLNIIRGPAFQSINTIFSQINQLHSVHITSNNPLTIPLFSPPKYSTIKQLSIMLKSPKDLIRLLSVCPELTCLCVHLQNCNFDNEQSIEEQHSNLRIFSLRTPYKLNVCFDQLKHLLRCLPSQLENLALEIETNDCSFLDGQVWEDYFRETFPQLNHLEFFMLFRGVDSNSSQLVRIVDVLKTFQGEFWSSVTPQQMNGYYNRVWFDESMCIHTNPIPIVQRRRFFLY